MRGGREWALLLSFILSFSTVFGTMTSTKQTKKEESKSHSNSTRSFASHRLQSRLKHSTSFQYTSLNMKSQTLADRWNFIIDSPSESALTFQKLLHDATHTSHKSAKSKSKEVTLTSIAWSTGLSLLAILGISCASSFSTILYNIHKLPVLITSKESNFDYSKVNNYIFQRFVPKAIRVTYKMILMDFWRNLWLQTFSSLRELHFNIHGFSYYETIWERHAPGWLRRGVRAYFVKNIQTELQKIFGSWISSGVDLMTTSTWLDESLIGDSLVDGEIFEMDDDEFEVSTVDESASMETDIDESLLDMNTELIDSDLVLSEADTDLGLDLIDEGMDVDTNTDGP